MTELSREYGMIDAAGQTFTITGYFKNGETEPRFIMPIEVINRMNVIVDLTSGKLVKCRWASVESEDAQAICLGLFNTFCQTTSQLKARLDGTQYGSRTHRSI